MEIFQYITVIGLVNLGLGSHLFVKVPRPKDSEVTILVFELSCYLLLLV